MPRYRPFGLLMLICHIKCYLPPAVRRAHSAIGHCHFCHLAMLIVGCYFVYRQMLLFCYSLPADHHMHTPLSAFWLLFPLFCHTQCYFATSISHAGNGQAGPPRGCCERLINTPNDCKPLLHGTTVRESPVHSMTRNEDTMDAGHPEGTPG